MRRVSEWKLAKSRAREHAHEVVHTAALLLPHSFTLFYANQAANAGQPMKTKEMRSMKTIRFCGIFNCNVNVNVNA